MFKKLMSVVVVTLLAVCAFCLTGCGEKKSTELVIGGMGPLTGPAAVYGQAVYNSASMAVEEINANGGLSNGLKLKLEFLDDKHDASLVQGNYYDLLENKGMQVSLGCVTTNPCLNFAKFSATDNVFFLTPSASNDDVPKNPNGYQMCFADGKQGKYAADYVNENFKGQTIGIFYKADDNYSKGIFDQFKAALSSEVTTVETSFVGDASDFKTQAETIGKEGVKFVFMPIYYTPASQFMLAAQGVIADDAVFFGCDGFDGIDSIEGFNISSIKQEVSMLSHFDSKATEGNAGDFIKKYKEKYGADTLNQFGASAYDCVYAIVKALNEIEAEKPGSVTADISASDLCDLLKAKFNGGFTFTGVTGDGKTISWGSDGFVSKSAVKYVIKNAN